KLDADDARLLQGVFEFSEKTAREVMTPRTEMVALPADLTLEEAADQVAVAGRSRYPVYGESLDDILGIVHAKDILAGVRSAKGGRLPAVLRPAVFVPGTREVEDVLADMKRQKIHLAIVLDEFGGTAGLVTMEDLLEEIVGPIYDEYARPGGDVKLRSTIAPIPPGALDLAGEAVRRRRTLQRAALERLGAAGYEEIIPPTFEYAEVFVRAAGAADVADRLIRFFDLDGKLLA